MLDWLAQKLTLQNVAKVEVTVDGDGHRVLTAFTPLSTVAGSDDWEEFRELKSGLLHLLDAESGYDEIRIQSLGLSAN